MIKVAVFASGSGTNAENIARYFTNSELARIDFVLTNNEKAGVINRMTEFEIPVVVVSKKDFQDAGSILQLLRERKIDFIVLAGFLQLIPTEIINNYLNRIINIHPALLPLHGGKGFYGEKIHRAVLLSKSVISGITIHHVNNEFDEGEIIFQAACYVSKDDSVESLSGKIHKLEQAWFPVVIEKIIRNQFHPKPEIR